MENKDHKFDLLQQISELQEEHSKLQKDLESIKLKRTTIGEGLDSIRSKLQNEENEILNLQTIYAKKKVKYSELIFSIQFYSQVRQTLKDKIEAKKKAIQEMELEDEKIESMINAKYFISVSSPSSIQNVPMNNNNIKKEENEALISIPEYERNDLFEHLFCLEIEEALAKQKTQK